MNKETRAGCPVCGLPVGFRRGVTNRAGEPIMQRHWHAENVWMWCKGSNLSLRRAAELKAAEVSSNG